MPGHSKVIGKKDGKDEKSIELEGITLKLSGAGTPADADTGADAVPITCVGFKKGTSDVMKADLGDDYVSGTEYEIACKSNMMMSAVLAIVFAGLGAGAYHMYLQRK